MCSSGELFQRAETLKLACFVLAFPDGYLKPEEDREPMLSDNTAADTKPAESSNPEHAEVLAELERLQTKKPGWGGAIILLVVSMALFLAAGAAQWSWEFALLLIPILLFHELGHYLAMKAFKYRNLRMFFIPFFGAAVSGQHYNVPGWKKVVVSLMGPLPGILLAIVLGVAGMLTQQPFLLKVALVTVILNGFNLIPVLPLDGGWVMHALLFSRHYMLDVAFRFVAAITLMVASLLIHDLILRFIGIALLLGLWPAYRMARIASELRKRELPPALPVDQQIPTQTAQVIIGEVKTAFPKGVNNRTIAQYTLQIFETLNARPPSWAATIGLLAVYGGSGVLAVLFAALFIVGQQGDLRGFIAAAARAPRNTADCAAIETWRGAGSAEASAKARNTLVATWRKPAEAQRTFQTLIPQLPPDAVLTRFGSSVLLCLPADDDAARRKWLEQLQTRTKNVFVSNTNQYGMVSLSCIAPDATVAASIESDANGYFLPGSAMFLTPPWIPGVTKEQQQARELYVKLQTANVSEWNSSNSTAFHKKIANAQRLGDQAKVKKLRDQYNASYEEATRESFAKLRQEATNQSAREVIDLYQHYQAALKKATDAARAKGFDEELASREPTRKQWPWTKTLNQLAVRMGQLEMDRENPVAGADRYSVRWGSAKRNGLLMTFQYLSFSELAEGLPSMAQWLCSKGCKQINYEFHSDFDFGGLEQADDEMANELN